ncbi:solute carrier family 23 protein [Methylocucumis oryzae]|uniref:solute carrier family 23 protein n=1 Tax=Methylocucumis oryzae TaxID=1632867 RepID=UPI0023BAC3B5|nr:solute carrier family 23 protein [Methylocucumis oryzae]
MRKPEHIVYGTDEKPPLQILALLALQQMSFLGVYLVISPLLARQLGLNAEQSMQLISATLVASGLGVVLQTLRYYQIGSGYFCPLQATSSTFCRTRIGKSPGWRWCCVWYGWNRRCCANRFCFVISTLA